MRKRTHWLCAAFILSVTALLLVSSVAAQEYTSRMEVLQNEALAGDFVLQGEYLAQIEGQDVGLHLIADGGGKFRFVVYIGGLPGAGWNTGGPRLLGTAAVSGNEITFDLTEERNVPAEMSPGKGETKGTIVRPQGGGGQGAGQGRGQGGGAGQFRGTPVRIEIPNHEAVFERQFRQSPTMGAEAPEGALVIFDGTNLDKFRAGARINEVPALQRPGGGQQGQGPGQGQGQGQRRNQNTLWAEAATTAFEKKPYKMHIEFMLSYMPQARGQARSNSGVYIDERYELQVLDSFGLEGADNECGGFYTFARPAVNMCFPPLTWQTYEIDFTPAQWDGDRKTANARVTVKHNDVLIHENLELRNHTPGRRNEGPEPLGLYLQGHGNRVQYRNIWIQYQDWPAPVAQTEPAAEATAQVVVEAAVQVEATAEVAEAVPRARTVASQPQASPQQQPLFPRLRALRR